jgi:hypothetical protein
MDTTSFLRVFLPSWLFDYFDATDIKDSPDRIDVYFDEKKIIPSGYESLLIYSHGFTPYYIVQDFPVRGKEVYLHLRRHKWKVVTTGEVITGKFDFAHEGTRLTKEFVAFLKETNRE